MRAKRDSISLEMVLQRPQGLSSEAVLAIALLLVDFAQAVNGALALPLGLLYFSLNATTKASVFTS